MQKILIQQWDEKTFFNSRKEWNELVNRSEVDPLFLSWEWQSSWWKFFSDSKMQLRIFVAIDDNEQLLGIAPLYANTYFIKSLIKVKRLQFIGNCWREKSTMPSELLDFIVDKNNTKEITKTLCGHINNQTDWDELVFPFLNMDSSTCRQIYNTRLFPGCHLRQAEKYKSYSVTSLGSFQDYKNKRGKNTRLSLFNRRKNLQAMGDVSYQRMLTNNISEQFTQLNRLHEKRWGKAVFTNERLKFNTAVATLMAEKDALNFSTLSLNDNIISMQYNYVINNRNYNIQAGFDENFHPKISLGYLHFGYEIEASFHHQYTQYDLLAGEGKNTQYKERLTSEFLTVIDLQVIRRPLLKVLYRFYRLLNR